ncbi:uncharacterized protein ATNIH1004_005154 [Aspergillus tanneri]|uniref:MOSC domain-containing protein n=1 Tax=Aspergillus tanneri TaxID=1220188 RepID=A0A5M9MQT8_9EURO|nr:uncharacterized protein ATNIH1004_005154 [Aspergillus tanneri]KAA8649258.1 hypothetical protein ATNIH1004_005154 [Aspergillus tanneri]
MPTNSTADPTRCCCNTAPTTTPLGPGVSRQCASRHVNGRNICIGNIIHIGRDALAQVIRPRQPCFKLSYRFQVQEMSWLSQERSRTGWYYRVLQEGFIKPGDEMALEERVNSAWTVSRVQHYLYIEMWNYEALGALATLELLGTETRSIFANRVKKVFENQEARLLGDSSATMDLWAENRLAQKQTETVWICSFRVQAVNPVDSPEDVKPGTHVRIKLGNGLIRAYSVVSGNQNCFELGVALDEEASRGGSVFLHDYLQGVTMSVSKFAAMFSLSTETDNHVLIAGGIGVAALVGSAL